MRFKINFLLSALSIVTCLFTAPITSTAAVITYTSQASFIAAITAAGIDTFDDLAAGSFISGSLVRSAGSHSYQIRASEGFEVSTEDLIALGFGSDIALSTNFKDDTIVIENFSTGIRAVGGNFFGTDIDGNFFSGQKLNLTEGSSLAPISIMPSSVNSFFGFISTEAITSLTISAVQTSTGFNFATINNLILGQAGETLPEPGSLMLFALGFVAVGCMRKQTRSKLSSPICVPLCSMSQRMGSSWPA